MEDLPDQIRKQTTLDTVKDVGRENAQGVTNVSEEHSMTKKNNSAYGMDLPKGANRVKAMKFRQYILEHVRQMRRPMNRENAFKYWMGELKAIPTTLKTSNRDVGVHRSVFPTGEKMFTKTKFAS